MTILEPSVVSPRVMGLFGKKQKTLATELVEEVNPTLSQSSHNGRRLVLKFIGLERPELDHIEFWASATSESFYRHQGDKSADNSMSWSKVPQALALIFLDYLSADPVKTIGTVSFHKENGGDLAGAFCNAIKNDNRTISDLFAERQPKKRGTVSLLRQIFGGKNIYGQEEGERRVWIESDHLPKECIEVYWTKYGDKNPILSPKILQEIARRIRVDLEIPTEGVMPYELPITLNPPQQPVPLTTPATDPKITNSQLLPPASVVSMPDSFLESMKDIAKGVKDLAGRETSSEQIPQPETVAAFKSVAESMQKFAESATIAVSSGQNKENEQCPKIQRTPTAANPPIDPALFQIQNPKGLIWEDSMGLLDFGEDDSGNDIWTIKDACEGTVIYGAPGSGKTSGSGYAVSGSFLKAGFGGLVLVAKTDEAQRWKKLCAQFGRADDCIIVTRDGPQKLNILDYETQRPGERLGLTDDLISFFRILIAIVSKRPGGSSKEDFWINATNQLMRALFDAFLLAGESLTVDSLNHFISQAPKKPTEKWADIEFFGSILTRAKDGIKDLKDQRVYENCLEYWTVTYPSIADVTRSGITLGFTSMADSLSGRGIFELISSQTTLTPETILSGKIVILDLPIKDCGQGGLLVQAAWKYLFQKAIERRADKGLETARPVFLWEDEGHLFFSQHDIDFQPTARDCRAAHVIISQNLHNFYQLGHNPHAVQGVFATMNTQIFHANGDLETNTWASKKLGTTLKTHVNVSISSQPKRSTEPSHWLWDVCKQESYESTSSTSVNQQRENILQPEDFAQLKKGGDGSCEAVILWVSHQFQSNQGRPFCKIYFEQGQL